MSEDQNNIQTLADHSITDNKASHTASQCDSIDQSILPKDTGIEVVTDTATVSEDYNADRKNDVDLDEDTRPNELSQPSLSDPSLPVDFKGSVDFPVQVPKSQTTNSSPNDSEAEISVKLTAKESFREKISKFDTSKTDERERECTSDSPERVSPDSLLSTSAISVLKRAKEFEEIINNEETGRAVDSNLKAKNIVDKATEYTGDDITENMTDKTENVVDETAEYIVDGKTDNTIDGTTENIADKTTENTVDGTTENTVDRKTENIIDEKTENIVDGATENTVDGTIENTVDRNSENIIDGKTENIIDGKTQYTVEEKTQYTIDLEENTEYTTDGNLAETKNIEHKSDNRDNNKSEILIENGIKLDTEDKEIVLNNMINAQISKTELHFDKQRSDKINCIDKVEKTVPFHMLRHCESIPNINESESSKFKLGKQSPIYRLSLRLSQYLPHCIEIPNADSHRQYDKAGYLQKQIGRGGFPYLNQWKRRYCVLTKGRLFLYEKDSSKGNDKSTNVVDLKYFDHVAEAVQKETKKASNVFVVTSQDRSFFDPGRHLFAADTLTDMHDWVAKLREAIELIRNNNRPTPKGAKGPVDLLSEAKQKQREDQARPLQDSVDGRIADDKKKDEFSLMLDEKLKRESSESKNGGLGNSEKDELKELVRDDLSASKRTTTATKTTTSATTTTTKKIVLQNPSFNVEYKPQLESITKHRIKGPSGRRAPQSRRTMLMKQRASSMSALQPDGDPAGGAARSGSAQGYRTSTVTADEVSLGENMDNISAISSKVEPHEMNMSFDDIESALFFQKPSPLREGGTAGGGVESGKKRRSVFSFRYFRISRSSSEKGPSGKSRPASIFRTPTFKFNTFRSNTSPTSEHPDSTDKSRGCIIL